MNFLAHFYLAYGSPNRLAGQFIADAVKGKSYEQYAEEIRNGIRQHRLIDGYTDTLEHAMILRAALRPHCGVLSSIAVDMIFDHALALSWKDFHSEPLESFSQHCYDELAPFESIMPERMKITFDYMRRYDWLSAYQHKEGLVRSIKGLSQRVTGGEKLLNAIQPLDELTNIALLNIHPMMNALAMHVKTDIQQSTEPFLSKAHQY